ncbi:hypothetical protein KVV02_001659, partial [Mortierella alpina]
IMSAARDSSTLQRAVGRHQLRKALVELQQEEKQEDPQPGHQRKKGSDVFCANDTLLPSDTSDDDFSVRTSRRTSIGSTGAHEGKSHIDGPGEPSCALHGDAWHVNGVNVSDRLLSARRINVSEQNVLFETDDILSLNFIFTKSFIDHCFDEAENDIVAHLVDVDTPEVPCEETDLVVRTALNAGSMKYLEFKSTLKDSSLQLSGLAEDILTSYTATNALWQSPTQLVRNEDTYIKQSVMPMVDAVFGSLDLLQHWQRDPLPVPNGYEEVLQPDFFAEVDDLCFVIMEVKKPTITKEEAEADTRKLPCMMKIALDTLIHGNVKGATVVGFLVKENVCEVLTMTLEHEALYIPKSLGCFKLPQDRLDIASLLLALRPLTAVKTIAFKMVKAIKKRSHLGAGKYSPMTRPSYYIHYLPILSTTFSMNAQSDIENQDPSQVRDPARDPVPQQQTTALSPIEQTSVFTMLPSELILEIFSYLDIVTIFRFLDTCRYHRYLLLNLPGIWRRIRFIPLSEYSSTAAAASSSSLSSSSMLRPSTTLSKAAEEPAPSGAGAAQTAASSSSSSSPPPTAFTKAYTRPSQRFTRPQVRSDSSSDSDSGSDEAQSSTSANETAKAAHRLKHAENDRDKDRGGSRTLISEVYAVLRRFRKENRLIDFVREIYMDSTDTHHFPEPLVMLIKFPCLEVISSRYRRKHTSLITDTRTIKDWLRNSVILPHSLRLRRWDIFHPYMVKEDVAGFKSILDAITIAGKEAADHPEASSSGVVLDIRICPGPEDVSQNNTAPKPQAGTHAGGGLHWAPASAQLSASAPATESSTNDHAAPACSNIVWTLEKCRVCDAHQERCWCCVHRCKACNAVRVPPYINHQTALARERARQTSGFNHASTPLNPSATTTTTTTTTTTSTEGLDPSRPRTPPGSISLTQMVDGTQGIASAYLHPTPGVSLTSPYVLAQASLAAAHTPQTATLTLPPEFSLFD